MVHDGICSCSGTLGVSLAALGSLLGRSWLWGVWGDLGASWANLGRHLGTSWDDLGRSWGDLGWSWGDLWGVLGGLGAVLGGSWSLLGRSKIDPEIDPKFDSKTGRIATEKNGPNTTPVDVSELDQTRRALDAITRKSYQNRYRYD